MRGQIEIRQNAIVEDWQLAMWLALGRLVLGFEKCRYEAYSRSHCGTRSFVVTSKSSLAVDFAYCGPAT